MRRRLFRIASLLSLLLCLATVVFWVRSGKHIEGLDLRTRWGTRWQFFSSDRVGIVHVSHWPADTPLLYVDYLNDDSHSIKDHLLVVLTGGAPGAYTHEVSLFRAFAARGKVLTLIHSDGTVWRIPPSPPDFLFNHLSSPMSYWAIGAPHWMLFTFLAVMPAAFAMTKLRDAYRSRTRRRRLLCPACGYNLTGNTSGVCPECGTLTPG